MFSARFIGGVLKSQSRVAQSFRFCSVSSIDSTIPIKLVKELRESTDAPVSECKKALKESSLDITLAHEWLRKNSVTMASKLSVRSSTSGLVGIAFNHHRPPSKASIVEISSETDFVARNDVFHTLIDRVSNAALSIPHDSLSNGMINTELLLNTPLDKSEKQNITVKDALNATVGSIRENIQLRRAAYIKARSKTGVVTGYVHQPVSNELGPKAAIISIESTSDDFSKRAEFERIGKLLAMHVVAEQPVYLTKSDIPESVIGREKQLLREKALHSGKPEKFMDKIVSGQLEKFYESTVFLNQKFIHDEKGKETVQSAIKRYSKSIGVDLSISDFCCFNVGEKLIDDEVN